MIQPYLVELDANADFDYDSMNVRFDVYPANSNTKLFRTDIRNVTYPAPPCTNPSWVDHSVSGVKFLGKDVTRSHMAIGFSVECQESGGFEIKEAFKTFVYSAAVDAAGGSVWTKVYNLELLGFDGIDVDGDLVNELVLTMAVPYTTLSNPDSANSQTNAFEGVDGTELFQKQRAFIR